MPKRSNLINLLLSSIPNKLLTLYNHASISARNIPLSRLPYQNRIGLQEKALDNAHFHGLQYVSFLMQSYFTISHLHHYNWSIHPNGDLRKLVNTQVQLLPAVATNSRIISVSRAPILLNPICESLFEDQNVDIFLLKKASKKLNGTNWKYLIDPFDIV